MKFLNKLNFIQFVAFLAIILYACDKGPQPIEFGKDNCSSCKMTISDQRFGLELITNKGKCYKFDDVHCLRAFVQAELMEKSAVKGIYVIDFAGNNALMDVNNALFLQGGDIKSPMGGNVAAFSNLKDKDAALASLHAQDVTWGALNILPK